MRHRVIVAALAALTLLPAAARAATPELSVSTRLDDRREVASGPRSYSSGFEDGRFYANGWHISGEMGGVWAPPLKLADGVWFGVGDQWAGPATRFYSGQGYTRYDLPDASGLQLPRTDFTPDGSRAALFGLTLTNPGDSEATVPVKVDAHSELMTAYPWGFDGVKPNASDNIADTAPTPTAALVVHRPGRAARRARPPLRRAGRPPADAGRRRDGRRFRGPQAGHRHGTVPDARARCQQCNDGPFGQGTGGELRYTVTSRRRPQDAVGRRGGLGQGPAPTREAARQGASDPAAQLAARWPRAQKLAATQVSLPGDPLLQNAIDWGKQNLADLTQTRRTCRSAGPTRASSSPPRSGTIRSATWFGAGFPDYPWMFATDGEYTDFAAVGARPVRRHKAHLRTLRDISDMLNNRSGVVVHETVDRRLGLVRPRLQDDATADERLQHRRDGQVPERRGAGLALDGRQRFRDQMYDFAKRNLHVRRAQARRRRRRLARGLGQRRAHGMGAGEARQRRLLHPRRSTTWPTWRRPRHDKATVDAGRPSSPTKLEHAFEGTWWTPRRSSTPTRSIDPGNEQSTRSTGSAQTPMEAELLRRRRTCPASRRTSTASTALAGPRERLLQRRAARQPRPVPHGLRRRPRGRRRREIFSLNTAIQAVGEGNYGRLGAGQQQRYTAR